VDLHYNWHWEAIPQYLFRFDEQTHAWVPNFLIKGFLTTIKLSIWSTVLATLLGVIMALFRVSKSLLRRMIGRTYVELIRNMPPLVLVFIVYYFISDQILNAMGINNLLGSLRPGTLDLLARCCAPVPQLPVFISAVIMLALYEGAYITEIVRGGIDSIEKGQLLGSTKSFFGLFKSECRSPVTGVAETFSRVTGNLGVREPAIPIEVTAYVQGKVVEVTPEDGCVVEARGAFVQGIFGVGGERLGAIRVVVNSPSDRLTPECISEDMKGQIIVGGSLVTLPALTRASELGVAGVVVGGIVDTDVEQYVGHSIGVAITGQEEVGSTLIITEGFGPIQMAQRTFDLLKANEGRQASVNGATQIRAGVIRPELIIPLAEHEGIDSVEVLAGHTLEIGTPIRIIREPYFGQLASVSGLPSELTKIGSGAMVRVLEAELRDGQRVIVPRANVEIIET